LDYRNKPELAERLAGEYVLGTLRGPARARFRRWMAQDGAVALAVHEWEARLSPLADAVAPQRPPGRVWNAIESRLGERRRRGFFWQGLAWLASGAAAAMLAMAFLLPALKPAPAAYVALLTDPKTQRAVLYVSADRKGTALRVKALDPSIRVADASLELWALPRGGKPRSLGLVPGERGVLPLAAVADEALGDVPMLAVSLEPKGGSPTGAPTGPVLYSGPCVKDW